MVLLKLNKISYFFMLHYWLFTYFCGPNQFFRCPACRELRNLGDGVSRKAGEMSLEPINQKKKWQKKSLAM